MSKNKGIGHFFSLLFLLIRKDLRLLMRSKTTISIMILGPIFLILLLGFSFNSSGVFGINIGVYATDYTQQDIVTLIQELEDNAFSVSKTGTLEECTQQLEQGQLHLCLDVPLNFDVSGNQQKEVTFYVDYSRINLAFLVLDIVESRVEEQSSSLSLSITESLLTKISVAQEDILEQTKTIETALRDVNRATDSLSRASEEIEKIDTELVINEESIKDIKDDVFFLIENYSIDDDDAEDLIDTIELLESDIGNLTEHMIEIETAKKETARKIDSTNNFNEKTKEHFGELETSLNTLKEVLGDNPVSDATTIVNPITTSIEPLSSNKTNLDYMAPILIVLVIMFMALFLSATIIVTGNTTKAFFRTKISLTGNAITFLASYITVLLILAIQLSFFIGVSTFFWNISFNEHMYPTLLTLFLLTTFFILLGILVGYLPSKQETAVLSAISLTSIFLLFSDLVFPLESMPTVMKNIAEYNPFVMGTLSLNKALLFGSYAAQQLMTVLTYSVLCMLFITILYHVRERRLNQ